MNTIYIGVDPGQKGGFSVILPDSIICAIWDDKEFIETIGTLAHQINDTDLELLAVVEWVGAMPKQGLSSTFNFGKSAGFIEGVLQANKVPYQLVKPREWKKHFGLNSDKELSCARARQLFPDVDLKATSRCKKDHDGKAESLLLAEYARRLRR